MKNKETETSNRFSSLPNPKEEKNRVLLQISTSYETALKYYKGENIELAEQEFVKVLKPVLSKPAMKNPYIRIEDVKQEELLGAIYHLGLIYQDSDKYPDNYSKAAAIFQYCAGFAVKHKVGNTNDFLNKAYNLENEFLESIGKKVNIGTSNNSEEISSYKSQLEEIRNLAQIQSARIREFQIEQVTEFAQKVEEDYKTYTKTFVNQGVDRTEKPGLVQQMLNSCFKQLGQLPKDCEYSIISFGSLAGGKMTPWSDLEFGILINEDKEEYKEYFRNLTKLLHIKVINLGETPLRSNGIELLNNFRTAKVEDEWFWDDVLSSGFSFDGPDWHACKQPLGRQRYKAVKKIKNNYGIEEITIEKKEDYELILTPKQLAEFQKEEKGWCNSDKHLVQALKSVGLIDGSQNLLDDYREEIKNAENPKVIKERSLRLLQEDVGIFSLKLGDEEEGKLFNIKKDIFRISDRIIDALANYYWIEADKAQPNLTAWDIIGKMEKDSILSKAGTQHLKETLSIATGLRLATYCHNQGQNEGFSTYKPVIDHLSEKQKKQLIEETFYIKDTSILHHFYYVMLKVQSLARQFCESKDHESYELSLKSNPLFDDSEYTKGLVHARFLEYDQALKYMETAKTQQLDNLILLDDLVFLYTKTGMLKKLVELSKEILIIVYKHVDDPSYNYNTAVCHNMLGNAYLEIEDYPLAIEHFNKALEIFNVNFKGTQLTATCYHNLGAVYSKIGDQNNAIYFYGKGLKIRETYNNNSEIASSYHNLGTAYFYKKEYNQAMECHNHALVIRVKIYKDNHPNHPDIAASYNALGTVCCNREEYILAIKYYENALSIWLKLYEHGYSHPDTSIAYYSLGLTHSKMTNYDQAIECYNKALGEVLEVYKNYLDHSYIAAIYNGLGDAYIKKGNYYKAIEYYEKELKIVSNKECTQDAAKKNNVIGLLYYFNGDYENALIYAHKALSIHSSTEKTVLYLAYWQLGNVALVEDKLDLAMQYYNAIDKSIIKFESEKFICLQKHYKDLAIDNNALLPAINCQQVLCKIDHSLQYGNHYQCLAYLLNKLGITYFKAGNYKKAIDEYQKALNLPGAENDITLFYNLARAYHQNKDLAQAMDYYDIVLKSNPNSDTKEKVLTHIKSLKQSASSLSGSGEFGEEKDIDYINSFFAKYTQEGIKDILDLRIKDLKIAGVQVLSATFINETNNNIREILSRIENITDTITLVPLNLSNKHAVGLILKRTEDSFFQVKYIDPMNNPIPSELLKIIQNILPNSQYKQIAVEQQRYANCGPEVVENFILYLTGNRVSQEKAIELHSKLVENSLLDLTIPNTCLLFEQSNYDKFQPDIFLSGNHNEALC